MLVMRMVQRRCAIFKMTKKGELVWDKLGKWILLLVLLIVILLIIMDQKERIYEALDSLKVALRFG
jgi:hypothetical protein